MKRKATPDRTQARPARKRAVPATPEPERQTRPPMIIEIDRGVSAGYAANRYDITIRGHAVSPVPIEEISLVVGDWVAGFSSYAHPEQAPELMLADGTVARVRGFQFNLPSVAAHRTSRVPFQIMARTAGDLEFPQDFELAVNPAAPDDIQVIAGPTNTSVAFAGGRPHIVMYIERATLDNQGLLALQGWAVSLSPILAVQVFADAEPVASARFGSQRDDVGMAFPSYPNSRMSGFSLTFQLRDTDQAAEIIRAQVVCSNGFGHEASIPVEKIHRLPAPAAEPAPAASEPVEQRPAADITMYCDAAALTLDGLLSLDGWAVCADGIAQVRVQIDGKDAGLATFGHERADVGRGFPAIPMANLSGFRFDHRVGHAFDGEHLIRVVVRSARDIESFKEVTVTAASMSATDVPVAAPDRHPRAAATAEQADEFKLELDSPVLADGAMVEPVTGRLTIEGWLLTRSGIASFEAFLGDQRLGDVHYGLARQDVGAAFPEWPDSLRSGFAFHCPPRSLREGTQTVRLAIAAKNGVVLEKSFEITVNKSDEQQESLSIRRRVPRVEVDMMLSYLADMDFDPRFRLIIRQDAAIDVDRLVKTIDTLRLQAYRQWSALILAVNADTANAVQDILDDHAGDLLDRFRIICPVDSDDWFAPLASSDGGRTELFGLLVAGDEPSAEALLEFAVAVGRNPGHGLFYADEVRVSPVSGDLEPFFKPDYSPDLLFATNYIGRPWAVTAAALAATGATPVSLWGDGEYDLLLRCAESVAAIHHLPKLLCQRGPVALDTPDHEQAALTRMLDRRGVVAEVLPTPINGTWRVKRAGPVAGKVSIIIPTCAAHGYIKTCIQTLRALTAYPDYEIICVDNIPAAETTWKTWLRENSDKIVDMPDAFNWSVFNNRAVDVADGAYLLFLNDDIEITHADWLDALVENAQRPEVGIVGPQLLYRDGKVQHAGMFLGHNGVGRHAFRFAAHDEPCYFGLARTQRNVIAVTGACMLVRREVFDRLGRFDEKHDVINNDLDFCLRVHRAGLLTVFTPYASLIHYELASRAGMKDAFDMTRFNSEWKTMFAGGDPYFSPRLSRGAEDYRPDDEPVQWVVSGAPIFHASEIARILVVKLDHIGDFVTALPPIRRLRAIFPNAEITVLAGPASRGFVSLEPCIDAFIPFSFFHARSQLGERELTQDDFADLGKQLRPHRFDLAVDLRKHPSTRDVLKYTGARFLAGYDYAGQFPFLDIALDWDGDRTLQRKRSHIVDDLLALVNTIGHATETDRLLMQPSPDPMPLADMPPEIQALFVRPVVAIHPGAGNITKQWPVANFSALIDLLIERNNVSVMLVGGPDDVPVADELIATIIRRDAVGSMAGKTPLALLPRLLKTCVLYIGNDSGPKHIAAAVGMPTLGIHSGVVDPVEWGPIGPNAVALRRNMACSPCYLANASDCSRGLACLRYFDPSTVYEAANLMMPPRAVAAAAAAVVLQAPPARPERKAKPKRRVAAKEPV